jgi:hypothetical protein
MTPQACDSKRSATRMKLQGSVLKSNVLGKVGVVLGKDGSLAKCTRWTRSKENTRQFDEARVSAVSTSPKVQKKPENQNQKLM